jgi:hypothetical protein
MCDPAEQQQQRRQQPPADAEAEDDERQSDKARGERFWRRWRDNNCCLRELMAGLERRKPLALRENVF